MYFSIQNARDELEKYSRLRGGLWTDGLMVGSCSERSRIVNDVSAVLVTFVSHFGRSFFVAGAAFGEVGQ